ncbi:amino acid/amide ABC transporter ATP-binding protein 1, HAAT family [Thalassovita litoralis]|jgi:branched-chain amino acid transport system ATP-binding protein|uniref:Amino acid/amide ABC transporter ATP-binding protein 1, HAAT family n=1 Tax=Thalassovita litoralis TaxID=1010611 RepID=A0A521CAF4_9RHOB|nr:ABC transporter ATP-binding protein [Thalassovita litoralis]SMO56409.1 amino acid/amide ABC transporter ATP-binding protein 1, HAAT family [Thalassovita litoralis]
MTVAALSITDLKKNFGPAEIIRGVNLEIEKGERHAIIGPNGAGKSTLFNLISGGYHPSSGSIKLNGAEIGGTKPFQINRMGLSRSFQVSNIFANMSVRENVRCGVLYSMGYGYSFWRNVGNLKEVQRKTAEILERVDLLDKANLPAALLPYADQRTLEIAITIAGGAEVILLDEPTAGMSHSETDRAVALIKQATEGKTLLIVEHDMGVVFNMADRISVLVYGEIIATGKPSEIRGDPKVREAYLGDEADALEGDAA